MNPERPSGQEGVQVSALLDETASQLGLRLIAGANGLDQRITAPRIQKPGFALSGHTDYTHPGRVQVLGYSEISFLARLTGEERDRKLRSFLSLGLCCIIVTSNLNPPAELIPLAEQTETPVLQTDLPSSACIDRVSRFLESKLAPHQTVHGDFLEVFGIGALLMGDSGIGKSECALELISRGHRLVSDDVVEIALEGQDMLVGSGPELTRYHMEIRGLGLLNIRDLFGVSSIRHLKPIELVVMLEPWSSAGEIDRLGLQESTMNILGVEVPMIRMPVAPGRNLSILVEVAARNHMLKSRGRHAARDLIEKMDRLIADRHAQTEAEAREAAAAAAFRDSSAELVPPSLPLEAAVRPANDAPSNDRPARPTTSENALGRGAGKPSSKDHR